MDEKVRTAKEEMKKKADSTNTDPVGACVYNAGSGTYCAQLTSAQCAQLGGTWIQGSSC